MIELIGLRLGFHFISLVHLVILSTSDGKLADDIFEVTERAIIIVGSLAQERGVRVVRYLESRERNLRCSFAWTDRPH